MNTSGFLVVNKPSGLTSRDIVNRAMAWFPKKTKLGHGGTLDPLATGVLVLAFGHATRFLEFVQRAAKTYTTTIILGADSDTDDADGQITPRESANPVSRDVIEQQLLTMVGDITQTPPAYSAAKISGRRAYDLARKGHEVELSPRTVRIDRIHIERYEWPKLWLTVDCGKGTYIRSIARDLGKLLGCGGYVAELHRARIGRFHLDHAVTLSSTPQEIEAACWPMAAGLADLPTFSIDAEQIRKLRFGQTINLAQSDADECCCVDGTNELIALGRLTNRIFQPFKVIPAEG